MFNSSSKTTKSTINSGNISIGSSTAIGNSILSTYPSYYNLDPLQSLKDNCIELYKQLLWFNVKKHCKDVFTEENHRNMLSMLESNDKDTLELLKQILIGSVINE